MTHASKTTDFYFYKRGYALAERARVMMREVDINFLCFMSMPDMPDEKPLEYTSLGCSVLIVCSPLSTFASKFSSVVCSIPSTRGRSGRFNSRMNWR